MDAGNLQRQLLLALEALTATFEGPLHRRRGGGTRARNLTDAQVGILRLAVGHNRHAGRAGTGGQGGGTGVIGAGYQHAAGGQRTHEAVERLKDALVGLVEVQVVGLNVRHHGNRRAVTHKGAVRFVGLGHKNRVGALRAQVRVRAATGDHGAHGEGGVAAQLIEHHGNHGAGRALAVGTGHRHHLRKPHHGGQRLGAVQNRKALRAGSGQLGVILANRGGNHHGIDVNDVFSRLGHAHVGAGGTQRFNGRRFRAVRTAHGHAGLQHQRGDSAHTRAADADEVHATQRVHRVALGERRVQGCRQHHLKIHQFSH